MSEGKFDNDAAPNRPPEAIAGLTESRRNKWLMRAGLVTLGMAGSLTVLIGAASYPLSGLLIRPRLKRLSHLKSPRLRNLIRRMGIEFEDVTFSSFDGTRLYGWWLEAAEGCAYGRSPARGKEEPHGRFARFARVEAGGVQRAGL